MSHETSTPSFIAVILAGGSGTRFWPRSRRVRAKQVLTLSGETSMIQQTVERLLPTAKGEDIWVLTNDALRTTIVPVNRNIGKPSTGETWSRGPATSISPGSTVSSVFRPSRSQAS